MDWQTLIIGIVSFVITSLLSWSFAELRSWIKKKASYSKFAEYLTRAVTVVEGAVKSTYQTYVEALKGQDMFTAEAQKEALERAKNTAASQLTGEVKDYIESTFGDVDKWIYNQIESAIYDLKKK